MLGLILNEYNSHEACQIGEGSLLRPLMTASHEKELPRDLAARMFTKPAFALSWLVFLSRNYAVETQVVAPWIFG
jgi:hypothetical protein